MDETQPSDDLPTPIQVQGGDDDAQLDEVVEGARVTSDPNGNIVVNLNSGAGALEALDMSDVAHGDNLVMKLTPSEQSALASRILEWVAADESSRSGWMKRVEEGLKQLGVDTTAMDDMAIKGASKVTHPLLAEAAVQFQARAIEELFPATGPVKGLALGDPDEATLDRATRVETYMNYYLTEVDKPYFDNIDQMMFLLPLMGSMFRKISDDPITNRPTSRYVKAADFLVPYNASSLMEATRYTHRFNWSYNDVRRAMAAGFYQLVDLHPSSMASEAQDGSIENSADDRTASPAWDDEVCQLLECHCNYEMPWDKDAPFALPYIVTVDKESQKVLSVRRNWREDDPLRLKQIWFVHYKYLQGVGFYGFGLLHIIGQLGAAATGLLRGILDGAARANFSGGFRSKEAGRKVGHLSPSAGEWLDVEMTSEELAKAFFPLPYKEPGPGIANALAKVEERGQRFASVTESMVGDAGNSGPVGTTMAMIEQGSKVFTGIHKRCHNSMGEELVLLRGLLRDTMQPGQRYPFIAGDKATYVMYEDFSDAVAIVPVSDPSIISSTQRITQAQGVLQLISSAPDIYGRKAKRFAHKQLLKAMKVQDIALYLEDEQSMCLDPITENQLMTTGKPVSAFQSQNHDAHIAVHQSYLAQLPPNLAGPLQGPFMAHIAEHLAQKYRVTMTQLLAQQTQGQILLPDLDGDDEPEELPKPIEGIVSVLAAQASAAMAPPAGAPPPGQPGQPPGAPGTMSPDHPLAKQATELGKQHKMLDDQAKQLKEAQAAHAEQQRADQAAHQLNVQRAEQALAARVAAAEQKLALERVELDGTAREVADQVKLAEERLKALQETIQERIRINSERLGPEGVQETTDKASSAIQEALAAIAAPKVSKIIRDKQGRIQSVETTNGAG